ncbi:MAG: metallophosphoesterase [Clostridia bacterium]|nr:metallophosphoesterase [Clostridia bacterium]
MTAGRFVMYIAIVIAVNVGFFFAQFALHKRMTWWLSLILFVVKFILTTLFALLAVAITSPFGWMLTPLTLGLYLTFLGDAIADLIVLIYMVVKIIAAKKHKSDTTKEKVKPMNVWLRGGLGFILTIAIMTYGMINMQIVTPKYHTFTSDKLQHEYTGIFIADLHYGSSQTEKTIDKAFERIKSENADFIMLGGDITDEYTTKEEMELIYHKIASIGVPTYFIYGNHDRQPKAEKWAGGRKYTDEELVNTITSNGIVILQDSFVNFADDLVIIGREDSSVETRKKLDELAARPNNAYVITVDHSPYQYDEIEAIGSDLQLSGHTHGGQYFPMGFNLNVVIKNVYGDFQYGNTHLYVSSGFSGWKDPFRTTHFCNYEVIHFKPAN